MMLRLNSIKIALLICMIYSRISLEQMKTAFYEVFIDINSDRQYSIVNPIFGYMFRTNGCLESMRFYSPELEIKYAKDIRDYKSDDSKDTLIRLLIHLFPSHGGSLNSLVRKKENFRNRYFIDNKPYWSKSGDGSEGSQDNRIETIKMLGETCVKLLKIGTGREMQEITKNNPEPYTLFNWLVFSPSKAFEKEEVYLKILLIQAFLIEALDEKEELKVFLRATLTGLDSDPSIKYPALLPNGKQMQLFKSLYDNPFKFPYSKINQPVSNGSIPVYDRKEDKPIQSKTFSDCADIAILHLCNCLFYDELTEKCSLDHLNNLKDSFTEPNRLKQFYKKYHHKPFQVTEGMRNDWSRVVQGLEDNRAFECQGKYKPYMIYYLKEDYRNELRSGILNIMSVLSQICGLYDEYKDIMTKGTITKDSIAEKLAEFFNRISNGNVKITIKVKDIKEIAYDNVDDFIGDFYITLDLKKTNTSVTMKLHISERHTNFLFEGMKSEIEEVDFTAIKNLKSDSDNILLSLLIDRYIKLLNGKDSKTKNFDYFFEVLYNQGALHTNKQKKDQCAHLCEYMDKIEKEERIKVKKMIENIVKSANLSDQATRDIFSPFFVFIKDYSFCEADNERAFRFWLSLYKNDAKIKSIELKNSWGEYLEKLQVDNGELGQLEINQSEISIDGIEIILQTLKTKIFDFILNGNKPWDANRISKALENFLDGNDSLFNLSILNMELESANLACILSKIQSCSKLSSLDLSNNCLGPKAMIKLAKVLKNKKTLNELNISNTNLGSEGIKLVCEVLKPNKTIRTLYISSNNLGSEGIRLICEVLETNETLVYLAISNNEYDSASAELLCEALEKNTNLKISKKDKIYTEFAKRLRKILKRKRLQWLFDFTSH